MRVTNTGPTRARLGYEILECSSENDLKQTVCGFLHIKEALCTVRLFNFHAVANRIQLHYHGLAADEDLLPLQCRELYRLWSSPGAQRTSQ